MNDWTNVLLALHHGSPQIRNWRMQWMVLGEIKENPSRDSQVIDKNSTSTDLLLPARDMKAKK